MKNFAHSVNSQPSAQTRQRQITLTEAGRLKLLIAIPALNEEKSIESIIKRSLAARDTIVANSPVTDVEITVVSDGSTDRTVEFASRYTDQIKLITFKRIAVMEPRLKRRGNSQTQLCLASWMPMAHVTPDFSPRFVMLCIRSRRTSCWGAASIPTARCHLYGGWATLSSLQS